MTLKIRLMSSIKLLVRYFVPAEQFLSLGLFFWTFFAYVWTYSRKLQILGFRKLFGERFMMKGIHEKSTKKIITSFSWKSFYANLQDIGHSPKKKSAQKIKSSQERRKESLFNLKKCEKSSGFNIFLPIKLKKEFLESVKLLPTFA